MSKRDHLRRLDANAYRGNAVVHWTMTMRDRRTGWLDAMFYYHFRELLTHSLFRYAIACPIFCLMPDHMHLIWIGILDSSDQKLAMKHLRTRLNQSLRKIDVELQDQPYDHVLRPEERNETAIVETCDYLARNPERAELVPLDGYAEYPYSGCLVPGYPELKPFQPDFWTRFDRATAYLRKNGLVVEFARIPEAGEAGESE
ncbi:hypothetical protein [Roseiconus lacunae]|uniref:hypothetical protein n=2 Tax=Roseiconus lacunae TaxID=2605694 RepID=UPI0011F389B7|nr:hypothetical protein [Roseiconus lacunae]